MTLQEWQKKYTNRYVKSWKNSKDAIWIPDFVGEGRAELWHLSDYFVSSVSGGVIWLVSREEI